MTETTIRRAETSEDWQQSLSLRGANGFTKHAFQGDEPRAGYWRLRKPGADPVPVHIVELCPTDPESGELVGDVTYECFMGGTPVPDTTVWPWCGKLPISAQEYAEMLKHEERKMEQPALAPKANVMPDATQSADIGELAGALAKAQGEVHGASRDTANPFFKSKYADLASVWGACREALSGNGLAVTQTTRNGSDGGTVTVITTLMHASGQWMRGELTMRPLKADPQGIGSAITYARRYALAAMVGVAPEDDDGEGAMGRQTKPEPRSARTDEAHQNAAEYANGLMAQIEACKTSSYLAELTALPKHKAGMARLEAEYPDLHRQVTNVQTRKALQLNGKAA